MKKIPLLYWNPFMNDFRCPKAVARNATVFLYMFMEMVSE